MKIVQPADYHAARDGDRYFTFSDGETCFPCHPRGTTWNGFDNVRVSPETRDVLIAEYIDDGTPCAREQSAMLAALQPDAQGYIDLGNGWAAELLPPGGEAPVARDGGDGKAKPACPKCGDDAHLYALGNDIRWNPGLQAWEILGVGTDGLECSECDHGATDETRGAFGFADAGLEPPRAIIVAAPAAVMAERGGSIDRLPSRDDVARVLFNQRQTEYDFDDAANADAESDEAALRSICLDDASAVLSLMGEG